MVEGGGWMVEGRKEDSRFTETSVDSASLIKEEA
jgi:hypothetical protein